MTGVRTVWVTVVVAGVLSVSPVGLGDRTVAATTFREAPAESTQWRRGSRARRSVERTPSEYRQIQSRRAITRAELAVVLSVRLDRFLRRMAGDRVVILTDTRDHWAERWILTAARAGVLTPSPTHEFEPDHLLLRHELAAAVAAVFDLADDRTSLRVDRRRSRDPLFVDLATTHISYQAAARAVSAGVLEVARDRFFHPTATVSGAEAVDAARRLERVIGR